MQSLVALMLLVLLACSDDDAGSGVGDECRLHPVYSLSIAGCEGAGRVNWCTGGRTVTCAYEPSEPICINGLCLNDVALQCEHPPPNSSCSGSPCPDDLAYRCSGTATIDGCTAFLNASMTENFPGTCP
jgi:hypothetical protein